MSEERLAALEHTVAGLNAKVDNILAGIAALQALNSNITWLKKHGPKSIWYVCGFITAHAAPNLAMDFMRGIGAH